MKLYLKAVFLSALLPCMLSAMEQGAEVVSQDELKTVLKTVKVLPKDQIELDSFYKTVLEFTQHHCQWMRTLQNVIEDIADTPPAHLLKGATLRPIVDAHNAPMPLPSITSQEFKNLYQYIKIIADEYDYPIHMEEATLFLKGRLQQELANQTLSIESLGQLLRTADALEAEVFINAAIEVVAHWLTQPENLDSFIYNPLSLESFLRNTSLEHFNTNIAHSISEQYHFETFLNPIANQLIFTIPLGQYGSEYVISENGTTVAEYALGRDSVQMWRQDDQNPLSAVAGALINVGFTLSEHTLVYLSPQGTYLIIVQNNPAQHNGIWQLFDTQTGISVFQNGDNDGNINQLISFVTCNHVETVIALGGTQAVWLYNIQNDTYIVCILLGQIKTLCFNADDSILAFQTSYFSLFYKRNYLWNMQNLELQNGAPLTPQKNPDFFIKHPFYIEKNNNFAVVRQSANATNLHPLTLQQALLITAIMRAIKNHHEPDFNTFVGDYHNPYNIKIILSPANYAYWQEAIESLPSPLDEIIKNFLGGNIPNRLLSVLGKGMAPLDRILKNNPDAIETYIHNVSIIPSVATVVFLLIKLHIAVSGNSMF